jgi:hypothetical protein
VAVSRSAPSLAYRLEYLVLVEPRPAGPLLGYLNEHPISSAVVDCFGRRYVYSGLAPRRRDGGYDIDALAMGERLIEPGLVYRLEQTSKKPLRSRLAAWFSALWRRPASAKSPARATAGRQRRHQDYLAP